MWNCGECPTPTIHNTPLLLLCSTYFLGSIVPWENSLCFPAESFDPHSPVHRYTAKWPWSFPRYKSLSKTHCATWYIPWVIPLEIWGGGGMVTKKCEEMGLQKKTKKQQTLSLKKIIGGIASVTFCLVWILVKSQTDRIWCMWGHCAYTQVGLVKFHPKQIKR